jgi:hypothetical protein
LDVKIWLSDVDGIDVCLSELPNTTSVTTIIDDCGKKSVQVLTEAEYNTVAIPYFEAGVLGAEALQARENGDEALAAQKEAEAQVKLQDALTALHAL